jgi:hypothetical protein
MLSPDGRSLYTDLLRPPPGHAFDRAVATTYALDLPTLVTVPATLLLFGESGGEELLRDPIALLEALRRTTRRLRVFCQRGRMHAPARQHPLFPLLEPVVREVDAPRGGAFHPKLWLLRFAAADAETPPLLRLAILSRNLAPDRCWDLSLVLEGRPGARPRRGNRPLAGLLGRLHGEAGDAELDLPLLADELLRTEWELPAGCTELAFHVTGLDGRGWLPARSDRLVVISPFVTDGALERLSATTHEPVALVSRAEELAALAPESLGRFGSVMVLAERAESEDQEDGGEEPAAGRLLGLHAKAYVAKRGWYTHLYVGSANATDAALVHGANVEVLAELRGLASQLSSIDELLGSDGFGGVLEAYRPAEAPAAEDPERAAAERAVEEARRALSAAGLRLACAGAGDLWRLELRPERPVRLAGIDGIRAWLVTQPADRAVDALPLREGEPLSLTALARASVSGFTAFEVTAGADPLRIRFVLNLPVDGLPADRDGAVLRSTIQDPAAFLRYLFLLLGGVREGALAGGEEGAGDAGRWWRTAGFDDAPLLEELTRALCRDPGRLRSIRRLVDDLRGSEGASVLPDGFLEMWAVFESAATERR